MGVAHIALDLGPGGQGSHRVHHHYVDGAGADQSLTDLQALLAGVRLGDEHRVDVHAQSPGIVGVQGVLGVDEGHLAAPLLGLGHNVEGQGGLTRGLGTVDLNDTTLGNAADAQRQIQGQGAGGDGLHHDIGVVAQAHDGALTIGLLDLGHGGLQSLLLIRGGSGALHHSFLLVCHVYLSSFHGGPGGPALTDS